SAATPIPVERATEVEIVEAPPVVEASVTPAPSMRRPSHKASVIRRPFEADTVAAGPRELCAARNFFMRPYCVERLCSEARFKKRAECTPAPARNEHY
ncbi:MAG: hypothetical protein ABUL50_08020, partial [Rhizobacter sp.]